MPAQGLQGKKFTGKVVEGFDPQQRGRYYVHVPDVMPHMPENEGYLCRNSTHSSRIGAHNTGTAGSSSPLHPGDQVEVICTQDDLSSMEICRKITDDQPKSDSAPGKVMGTEPSGKMIPFVVKGLPQNVPFGSAGNDIIGQFTKIMNSGGAMAQQLFASVKDKLGPSFDKIAESFKPGDTPSADETNFQESMASVDEAIEKNGGPDAKDQCANKGVDNAPIGPENEITEEEQNQGYVGEEDEIIDKFLGPKEGINTGD